MSVCVCVCMCIKGCVCVCAYFVNQLKVPWPQSQLQRQRQRTWPTVARVVALALAISTACTATPPKPPTLASTPPPNWQYWQYWQYTPLSNASDVGPRINFYFPSILRVCLWASESVARSAPLSFAAVFCNSSMQPANKLMARAIMYLPPFIPPSFQTLSHWPLL